MKGNSMRLVVRHTLAFVLSLAALPLVAGPAWGQSDEDLKRQAALALGVGRATRPGTPQLIQALSIQRDLKLNAQQAAQVRNLENRIKQELQKPSGQEKRKASLKLARDYKEVGDRLLKQEILTPEQYQRLQQILLQMEVRNQGLVMVFTLEKFEDKLGFSAEQRSAMARERKEFDQALVKAMREQGAQRLRPALESFQRASDTRILALLDAAQRQQWNQLTGKPFDFASAQDLPIRR